MNGRLSSIRKMFHCRVCSKLTHSANFADVCDECGTKEELANEHQDGLHDASAHKDCADCASRSWFLVDDGVVSAKFTSKKAARAEEKRLRDLGHSTHLVSRDTLMRQSQQRT